MNVDQMYDRIEELLDEGKPSLIGGTVKVNADEIRALIKEIRLKAPEELAQARRIAAERKDILAAANEAAEAKIKEAEKIAEKIASEHEITLKAKAVANEIITEAKAQAAEIIEKARASSNDIIDNAQKWAMDMRSSASEFVENIMAESEEILEEGYRDFANNLEKVRNARRQLKNASIKKGVLPKE